MSLEKLPHSHKIPYDTKYNIYCDYKLTGEFEKKLVEFQDFRNSLVILEEFVEYTFSLVN